MTPAGKPIYCPYTVAARGAFIAAMDELGYELVDTWSKLRPLVVPLYPDCERACYTGLYFRQLPGPLGAGAASMAVLEAEGSGGRSLRQRA